MIIANYKSYLPALFSLQVMEKLLIAAVADADVSVRQSVFLSLSVNCSFDEYLAQADSLTSIFVALNDEVNSEIELSLLIGFQQGVMPELEIMVFCIV